MIESRAGAAAAQSCRERIIIVALFGAVTLACVALPLCLVAGSALGWWPFR